MSELILESILSILKNGNLLIYSSEIKMNLSIIISTGCQSKYTKCRELTMDIILFIIFRNNILEEKAKIL